MSRANRLASASLGRRAPRNALTAALRPGEKDQPRVRLELHG